jgi:hypothetical protein
LFYDETDSKGLVVDIKLNALGRAVSLGQARRSSDVGNVLARPSVARFLTAILVPFLIAAALLLTFAPFILVSYAKHDDYIYSVFAASDPPLLYSHQAYNGRLVNGLLLYLILPLAKTIYSYRYIRLIGLAALIRLALRLYTEFRRRRAPRRLGLPMQSAFCQRLHIVSASRLIHSIYWPLHSRPRRAAWPGILCANQRGGEVISCF